MCSHKGGKRDNFKVFLWEEVGPLPEWSQLRGTIIWLRDVPDSYEVNEAEKMASLKVEAIQALEVGSQGVRLFCFFGSLFVLNAEVYERSTLLLCHWSAFVPLVNLQVAQKLPSISLFVI